MTMSAEDPQRFVEAIRRSGFTIYDPIDMGDPELWIPTPDLEYLLDQGLRGVSLEGLPLRTRSKAVKQHVCRVLGYPVPFSFVRVQPRFPGQLFDTYTQKSDNLQIWNEEIVPSRRYVIVRVADDGKIVKVKVVTGQALALFDTTGTLTRKYQARLIPVETTAELISGEDTGLLKPFVKPRIDLKGLASPVSHPVAGELIPISELFERLKSLVGQTFPDPGSDQERNRGADLHRLVCRALGYDDYRDDGRFPDIPHQLLEVKLQTSPTIDLGLVCPDSVETLDVPRIHDRPIRHCDVRYALFRGATDGVRVILTHFFLTTGESFFGRFSRFQGRVVNRKLQIPLPAGFFDG